MAIPIDIPIEHGGNVNSSSVPVPSTVQGSLVQQHGITSYPPFSVPPTSGNESFLHQLALELYSVYYEYCNSAGLQTQSQTDSISNVSVPQFQPETQRGVHDINNNSQQQQPVRPAGRQYGATNPEVNGHRRRRRHPAGRNGFGEPVSQENITPLVLNASRTSPALSLASMPNAHAFSEYELKLTVAENFGVGVQLRQIADIYENCQAHAPRMISSQKSIHIDATFSTSFEWSSWPVSCVNSAFVIGSVLLTSATAAAIFYFRRS